MTVVRLFIAILCAASPVCLPGCASSPPPSGVPAAAHVRDPAFLGNWTAGKSQIRISVEAGPSDSFAIVLNDGQTITHLRGYLLGVDGHQICEVQVYQPDAEERDRSAVPVYHYGLVVLKGDTIVHRPLRAAWLDEQAEGSPNVTFVTTTQLVAGSGGAVVRDGAAMQELLRKAVKDPKAFGDPETLTRVK